MNTKPIWRFFCALALMIPFGAQANDIEPGKEYYTAIKAVNPIVLDGDLSEWSGSTLVVDPGFSFPKGSADDPDVDGEIIFFEEWNGGTWTGPDDQTSAVQVVYDDENVYFGFIVTDEYHENGANDAWNGDSVQLMIANDARDDNVALYNYALGGVEGDLGDIIVQHERRPEGGADTEAVIKRDGENKRTIYEIKLPLSSMRLETLEGGVQFGLGMAINDGDEDTPGQKGWSGLGAHSIVHGKSPEQTARITLARANDMEPGKEFHSAKQAPGAIVLDGKLDDWEGVPVLSDPRFTLEKSVGSRSGKEMVLHEEWNGGTWTGPDDQTSAVQIAYDADNVYFAFIVTDDYHENGANDAWNGDSVQLMVANDKTDDNVALYNYALGGIEGDLGEVIVQHERRPEGGEDTEAVITRDAETKKTIYEIKLPKSSMRLEELASGVQFGLGMAINDGDEDTPGQKGWGGLGAHSIVHGKSPEETALVTLDGYAPQAEPCFASAIAPPLSATPDEFSFRGNNFGGCELDPATAELIVDGEVVSLDITPASLGATDFKHVFPEVPPGGSAHTYSLKVSDSTGKVVIDERGEFIAPIFEILTGDMQVKRVDKSKPGFLWRIFQNGDYTHSSLTETELALAGELVDIIDGTAITDNNANDALFGPAVGPGQPGPAELIEFEIPTVINFNALPVEGSPVGNVSLGEDDQMPGVPGINDLSDGADAEIITYVDFPAGRFTVGVNSDDGFRMEGGPIESPLTLGEFGRGRGAFDSLFRFEVAEAGIYPIRVIYFNNTGGASIELFSVKEDGTKVLFNDIENGGFPAYRSAPEEFLITSINREADNSVALTFQSKAGRYYAVDTSTDLIDWQAIVTEIPEGGAQGDSSAYTDTTAPVDATQLYYRVRQVPAPALYATDFEGDDGAEGWVATVNSGDTEWELGTPAVDGLTEASSGTQAWGTGIGANYGPNTVISLQSPVIDVSAESSPKLSFNYFIDSTFEAEGGQLRFLDEDGEVLATVEQIFSGQSESWTPHSLRFPAAARGGNVIIEYRFLTDDDGDVGAGWYIDDVRID